MSADETVPARIATRKLNPSCHTGAHNPQGRCNSVARAACLLAGVVGRFIWDDDAYVKRNPLLTKPDGLWRIWSSANTQSQYFPLTFTTLRFGYSLWGLNPVGYHALNIALHCVNALLAWAVLRRLNVPGAWFAALIFAVHPVQVETVAWITELKNIQSTTFYLLAVLARVLATTTNDALRNGVEAFQLVKRADEPTRHKNPAVLDTLAAAYAETGSFTQAVQTAERAFELALAIGNERLAAQIQKRLESYKNRISWRE